MTVFETKCWEDGERKKSGKDSLHTSGTTVPLDREKVSHPLEILEPAQILISLLFPLPWECLGLEREDGWKNIGAFLRSFWPLRASFVTPQIRDRGLPLAHVLSTHSEQLQGSNFLWVQPGNHQKKMKWETPLQFSGTSNYGFLLQSTCSYFFSESSEAFCMHCIEILAAFQ